MTKPYHENPFNITKTYLKTQILTQLCLFVSCVVTYLPLVVVNII